MFKERKFQIGQLVWFHRGVTPNQGTIKSVHVTDSDIIYEVITENTVEFISQHLLSSTGLKEIEKDIPFV